jgi:hypothetical protein
VLRWCFRCAAFMTTIRFSHGHGMDGRFCVDTMAERRSKGQLLIEVPCTVFEIAKA